MITFDPVVLDSAMLDEAKAYLRLETDEDDAPLGAMILAAITHAERFLNQMLIRRGFQNLFSVTPEWRRLGATPVVSVTGVLGVPAEGARFALPVGAYAIDLDSNADAWVRVTMPGSAGRVEVSGVAGIAENWPLLPETIRLGVLRLIGHLYANRDGGDDTGPPAAVAALLRPWRRMRLA
jgi:uncharacterized phiE125 gp8 family phage protein